MTASRAFFITGTDTGVGKTLAACGLLYAARVAGLSTAAVKPVAAGTIATPRGPQNEDVVALAGCCTEVLAPEDINPACLIDPVAPHIAAARQGLALDAATLAAHCRHIIDRGADLTLVEGAGGWKVPLGDRETLADLARLLDIPVILVVGMRLGCLNHALLTAQAITAEGLNLAGWIANRVDPGMLAGEENLATLRAMLPAPLLAEIPWLDTGDRVAAAARHMDIGRLPAA